MTTTSGRRPSESSDASSSIASAPPAASPSTSISGSPSRNASSPRRTSSWSSTTRTPMPSAGSWLTSTHPVPWDPDGDDGATPHHARDGELPADLRRTAAHRVEAEVTGMSGGGIEAPPVVVDLDDDFLLVSVHTNVRRCRPGVHQDIGKRLTAD